MKILPWPPYSPHHTHKGSNSLMEKKNVIQKKTEDVELISFEAYSESLNLPINHRIHLSTTNTIVDFIWNAITSLSLRTCCLLALLFVSHKVRTQLTKVFFYGTQTKVLLSTRKIMHCESRGCREWIFSMEVFWVKVRIRKNSPFIKGWLQRETTQKRRLLRPLLITQLQSSNKYKYITNTLSGWAAVIWFLSHGFRETESHYLLSCPQMLNLPVLDSLMLVLQVYVNTLCYRVTLVC